MLDENQGTFSHLGDNVVVQLEGDSTSGGAVDGNVKVTVAGEGCQR